MKTAIESNSGTQLFGNLIIATASSPGSRWSGESHIRGTYAHRRNPGTADTPHRQRSAEGCHEQTRRYAIQAIWRASLETRTGE